MKKFRSITILFLGLLIFSFFSCDKEKIITENDLPTEIKTYLETHFSTCRITKVIKDKENNELSYDITLDCGINVEFNGNNQVIDIDGTSK